MPRAAPWQRAGVAAGAHEDGHHVELETDRALDGRVLHGHGNGERFVPKLDLQFRRAVGGGRDETVGHLHERGIGERVFRLGRDVTGHAVAVGRLHDHALAVAGVEQRDGVGEDLDLRECALGKCGKGDGERRGENREDARVDVHITSAWRGPGWRRGATSQGGRAASEARRLRRVRLQERRVRRAAATAAGGGAGEFGFGAAGSSMRSTPPPPML